MNWVSTRAVAAGSVRRRALCRDGPDGGLYMPERLDPLPAGTVESLRGAGIVEIGTRIGAHLLRDEITPEALRPLVAAALDFPIPLVRVTDRIWALELFTARRWRSRTWGRGFRPGCCTTSPTERR